MSIMRNLGGALSGIMLALALVTPHAFAAPAKPILRTFTQPDGTVFTGKLQGDEWYHWFRTTDGSVFVRNRDTGAFELAKLAEQNGALTLVPTGVKVGSGYGAASAAAQNISDETLFQIAANQRVKAGVEHKAMHKPLSAAQAPGVSAAAVAGPHTFKTLVVLVEFSDTQITSPVSTWGAKIFGTAEGQLNHFYNATTHGNAQFARAAESEGVANDGFVRVRLNYPHPNPADDFEAIRAMLREALLLVDPYVNFASFDSNNDGQLVSEELLVNFLVAGKEYTAGSGGVWAHVWQLVDAPVLDGYEVSGGRHRYATWGEREGNGGHDATIGVIAHELGHLALHLPDLYPYLGDWDLMSYGVWGKKTSDSYSGQTPIGLSAHTKWQAGFIGATYLDPMYEGTTATLRASGNTVPDLVITQLPNHTRRYFALEHRRAEGYDLGLTYRGVPAGHSGVLVFSETGTRDGLSLLAAATSSTAEELFYPGNNNRLAPDTTPSSNDSNDGSVTGILFENIAHSGDAMTVKIGRAPMVPGADCRLFVSANSAHVTAGRAYTKTTGTWFKTTTYYAVGSNESLGTIATTQTTLKETPSGYFAKGSSCPAQTPPRLSDISLYLDGGAAHISGFVEDVENDLARVEIEIDGSGVWTKAVRSLSELDPRVTFAQQFSNLSQGQHTYRIRAADAGNRITLYGPIQFEAVGARAPTCTIDRVHRDSEGYYTAWGGFSDLDGGSIRVDVSLDSGPWQPATTNWEWTRRLSAQPNDLADGIHTVMARATDDTSRTGVCGPFELEVGVPHAPTVTIDEPNHRGDSLYASGAAADVDGDLAGVEAEFDGNGQWQLVEYFWLSNPAAGTWSLERQGLSVGSHSLRVRGVDAGGLRGEASESVYFEVLAPADPVCTIDRIDQEDGYLLAKGTISDANNDVVELQSFLLDRNEWVQMMYFGGNELWAQVSEQPLSAGNYTAQVRVRDNRGAIGYCSKAFSVGAAPTLGPVQVVTSGLSVTVSGTASDVDNDLAKVEVQYDSESSPWIIATGTTSWSHTNGSLTAGSHQVRVRATDAAGRSSAPSAWRSFSLSNVSCFTAVNTAHASAGRATLKYVSLYYANGTNTYLGTGTATTSLKQQGANSWAKVTSCP